MRANELAGLLARDAEVIARQLLPSGKRVGNEWEVGDLDDAPGHSLRVHLTGDKAGVWSDFSTGESGDLIGLWMARRKVSLRDACEQAMQALGVTDRRAASQPMFRTHKNWNKPTKKGVHKLTDEHRKWLEEVRNIPSTTIAAYRLASRDGRVMFPYLEDGELVFEGWLTAATSVKVVAEEPSTPVHLLVRAVEETVLVESGPEGLALTTSLVIAQGVDLPHRSVIQLIRTHLADLEGFGRVQFEIRPFLTAGGTQSRSVALLNEGQATLLMTLLRNNPTVVTFKARLVKAFLALREQVAASRPPAIELPDFTQPAIAARAWADQYEGRVKAEVAADAARKALAEVAPKIAFADQVAESDDTMSMQEAAQVIGTGRTRLMVYLRDIRWITHDNWPYQARIDARDMKAVISHATRGGVLHEQVTPRLTGRGLRRLFDRWRADHPGDPLQGRLFGPGRTAGTAVQEV